MATQTEAKIYKAPQIITEVCGPSVFLAGSIEMGQAEKWQKEIANRLKHLPITVFDPRRDDWNSQLKQSIHEPAFKEQVTWELECQGRADIIAMYLDPKTKSPISLLELGLFATSGKLVVCCPEGFWRRGNVEIVCERYGIPLIESFDEIVERIIEELEKKMEK